MAAEGDMLRITGPSLASQSPAEQEGLGWAMVGLGWIAIPALLQETCESTGASPLQARNYDHERSLAQKVDIQKSNDSKVQLTIRIDEMRCDERVEGACLYKVDLNDVANLERARATVMRTPEPAKEEKEERLPICPKCGVRQRPKILWFDESYNEARGSSTPAAARAPRAPSPGLREAKGSKSTTKVAAGGAASPPAPRAPSRRKARAASSAGAPIGFFVYGTLRPDDDSQASWTKSFNEGMEAQAAYLPGASLYIDGRYPAEM
ncbi:hypothetical protein AK812_SmicGene10594 [Symbiodinium microadriaticum]|uniref:Gamma-glutamylcyclotransferase AIG2-like domain-containing protein n=1 Tax=Symbiodinium microadriaticum TaxID=2951 RepID=A0A1Q9EFC3_SYMMI|nr:hypothetical protein AK812_SmicGene10594 [Symbiodinium microadriaticum]